jgi:hypothetical protein
MKSAYELAMERLEKTAGATRKLSDDEKERLAEIDRVYEAKIAEAKLGFDDKISQAANYEELHSLQAQMAEAVRSLNEKRDAEKDAIWNAE